MSKQTTLWPLWARILTMLLQTNPVPPPKWPCVAPSHLMPSGTAKLLVLVAAKGRPVFGNDIH